MVWGFANKKEFQVTTLRQLNIHNRSGVVLVDSTGTRYVIRRAYQTGWRGIHGWTGLQTGIITLKNDYEPRPAKISPNELRKMMTKRLLQHQDEEWFIETWLDEPTLREEFAECRTIGDLIALIVSVPKFSLWERIGDYFLRTWLSVLVLMFLWVILKKIWGWIAGY